MHFIGHSIGAKICVELVKRFRAKHNAATYLLFPTLERLAQTPNGRKIWPILGPLRKVVVFAASFVHRLPESWLATVVKWAIRKNIFTSRNVMCINYLSYVLIYIGYKGIQLAIENPTSKNTSTVHVHVTTTVKLLHPKALERSLFMACDELEVVGELNAGDIRLHSERCV